MSNIKDKIKKLLALAQSPNENEARSALLKARQLMAENKIEMQDVEEKEVKLVHIPCEEMTWTTDSGNIWMVNLAEVIANNYCCTASWMTWKGRRTHQLEITGLEDDAKVCEEVMKYAIGFINSAVKVLARKNPRMGYKTVLQSYAKGFILGLEMAFEDQNEQEQDGKKYELVLVKPQEVLDYEAGLGHRNVKTRENRLDQLAYLKGQNDGANFNAKRVLTA